jgi:dihydroneopterin aldolase
MDLGMLKTTWDFQRSINEAHTVIRVRNLQTSLRVETDAWGRRGRLQPVLISATLSLREPFESASGQDSVTSSTVHYGILSKAILEACDNCSHSTYSREAGTESTLMWHILRIIFVHLTQTERFGGQNVVLQTSLIQTLELELLLPKASVIGTGVSLKFATAFNNTAATSSAYRVAMSIHHLRVPTLIGVNSNERYAKQIVIANVELDCWAVEQGGRYCELEEIVVKVSYIIYTQSNNIKYIYGT